MKPCEDCGEESKRRTRCPKCRLLVCGWCMHHVHKLAVQHGNRNAVASLLRARAIGAEIARTRGRP